MNPGQGGPRPTQSAQHSQAAGRVVEVAQARLEAARIAHLYRMAVPAYFAAPVFSALLGIVLWGTETASVLSVWFACVLTVCAARGAMYLGYLRAKDEDSAAWERRFTIGALLAGAIWSAAPLIFFPEAGTAGRLAIVFVTGGALIGAAGLYAASRAAFLAFLALPLAATVYVLAAQPGELYRTLALMLALFAVLLYLVYRQVSESHLTALRMRLENVVLQAQLGDSEARLRDAIENAPDGIAVYDEQERLVTCNAAYAALYAPGQSTEALAGTRCRSVAEIAFDQAEQVAQAEAADREAWIARFLERHRSADGSLRQFRTRDGRWLQDKAARTPLGGRVAVFTDISEAKRAQAAYQSVLAEENLVLDILPVGFAIVEQRTISRCNRRLEQMLGYPPGALAGCPMRRLYGSENAWASVGRDTYARLGGGGIIEHDVRLVRSDGAPLWCRVLGRALDAGNPAAAAIFAFSDVQDRRSAESALRHSEALFRNLVETSNDLIWSSDRAGRWTYLNPAAALRIWGVEASKRIGTALCESVAPALRERDIAVFRRILGGEQVSNHDTQHLRADGTAVDLSFNAIPLRGLRGEIVGATGTARDITEARKAAAALYESVERLRLAVDAADLYYWEWDAASDRFSWGRDPAGLLGIPARPTQDYADFLARIHPEDRERYLAEGRRTLHSGGPYFCEFRVVRHDGQTRWLAARGRVLYTEEGVAARMIGVSQDVTDRKRQEEEVRYLAYHDTLTGLPNRRLLDDRLQQALFLAQRREAKVAVMLIDLDRFKFVNDSLGHKAGDAVLREVASRLTGCVRKADTLARHGGDEFVVVLPDLAGQAECAVVAEKILRTLAREVLVGERGFSIGASIGISLFPADAGDGDALLRNADAAMYRAKELGRDNYRFYSR